MKLNCNVLKTELIDRISEFIIFRKRSTELQHYELTLRQLVPRTMITMRSKQHAIYNTNSDLKRVYNGLTNYHIRARTIRKRHCI